MKKFYLVQNKIIEQAKFTYSSLRKAFEKQLKAIENQDEKQTKAGEDDCKQLVKSKGMLWKILK